MSKEYIPYTRGDIIEINYNHFALASEKFKNANKNKDGKIFGFAVQYQVFEDLVCSGLLKEDVVNFPESDYAPYDVEIENEYYDVKASIEGKTITISDREIKFADEFNTTFICLLKRTDETFEYLGTIDYLTLEENNLLRNSKYDNGYYFFISEVKHYFK